MFTPSSKGRFLASRRLVRQPPKSVKALSPQGSKTLNGNLPQRFCAGRASNCAGPTISDGYSLTSSGIESLALLCCASFRYLGHWWSQESSR